MQLVIGTNMAPWLVGEPAGKNDGSKLSPSEEDKVAFVNDPSLDIG